MTKPKIKIAQSLLEELDNPYREHYLRLNATEKEIIKEALSIWIITRRKKPYLSAKKVSP